MLLAGAPDEQESEGPQVDPDDLDVEDLEPDEDEEATDSEDGQGRTRRGRYVALYVGDDYPAHGHQPTWAKPGPSEAMTDQAQDARAKEVARAERRRVIDNNKAWRSAETVRRDWLRALLTRKTPPKGGAVLIVATLAESPVVLMSPGANDLAAELLGCTPGTYGRSRDVAALVERASDSRAEVLTLALVLSGYEAGTSTNSWRWTSPDTTRYLAYLASCGYTPAEVEHLACGHQPVDDPGQDASEDADAGAE